MHKNLLAAFVPVIPGGGESKPGVDISAPNKNWALLNLHELKQERYMAKYINFEVTNFQRGPR